MLFERSPTAPGRSGVRPHADWLPPVDDLAARVVSIEPGSDHVGGTGYRIGPRLILAADHAVGPVCEVLVDHVSSPVPARRVWASADLDIALLEVIAGAEVLPAVEPARWGRVCSGALSLPVEVLGYPEFQAVDGRWRLEQAPGLLNPLTAASAGVMHIDVTSGRWKDRSEQPWSGASGSVVLAAGLVVGVVVAASVGTSFQRLEAVPVAKIGQDPVVRRLVRRDNGVDLVVEGVELAAVSVAPARRRLLPHPAALLRPGAEVVGFHGRDHELGQLCDWVRQPGFGVHLLLGRAGEGKSRLARRLVNLARARGCTACFVRDFDRTDPSVREAVSRLRRLTVPTLIVVDQAETRPEQVMELADRLAYNAASVPVRLLLLARSAGWWWTNLRRRLRELPAFDDVPSLSLRSLPYPGGDYRQAFTRAVRAFGRRLGDVLRQPEWRQVPATIAPPAVTGQASSALAVQFDALAQLLAARYGDPRAGDGRLLEDALLDHELDYWLLAAETGGLSLHPDRLTGVLAAASLYGADDRAQANLVLDRLPGLSVDQRTRLRAALCELYGEPAGRLWAPLEPTALAERLVATQLLADRHLLADVLPYVTPRQAARALALLFRAATRWPEVGDLVAETLEQLGEKVPYDVVVGVGALDDNRTLFERVVHQAYPGRDEDNAKVLAALHGDSGAADTLWAMYTSTFAAGAGTPDTGWDTRPALSAIADAAQQLESFRGAEDALGQLNTIVSTIEEHAAKVGEWLGDIDRIQRQIDSAEGADDLTYVLREIRSLAVQFVDRATADAAKIDEGVDRIWAFAEEGTSTLTGLLNELAGALNKVARTLTICSTTKEEP